MAYDVLIVGAGPAGSMAALKFARAGEKVLLIEAAAQLTRKVCGEYLCPAGVELLKSEGLEHITRRFLPIHGMDLFSARGTRVCTKFPAGLGLAVNRLEFDSALLEEARQAGAEIRMGTRLESLEQFKAQLLVGADGRSSTVSRLLDNDVKIPGQRVALHCTLDSRRTNSRVGEMHLFEDGAFIGLDPTGPLEMNFSLVCEGSEIKKRGGPRGTLQHYIGQSTDLSTRFPALPAGAKVEAVFPVTHKVKSVTPRPNVALIGDAAGFVDPLTGEGIYNGLLTAKLLSEAATLREYARGHRQQLAQKIRLNEAFQFVIRRPKLVEGIGKILATSQRRADNFIGIVGNVHSPLRGLWRMI